MSSTTDEGYQASALKKGLEVLEFFSGQSEPYALEDLAGARQFPKRDLPNGYRA